MCGIIGYTGPDRALDILLPGLSGLEVLRRAASDAPLTRFVVVSGPAGKAQAIFDLWMRVGIGVAIVVFLARAATEGWRLYRYDQGARSAG